MSNKVEEKKVKPTAKPVLMPKLRFPEFRGEGEWEVTELGLLTTKVGSGITPTGGDKNYKAEGRPFVRSQNVGWGELILNDVAFIDEETHRSFKSSEIKVSDVLLNITGASIGRSVVADSRIAGGNVNQHVCIIRVKQDELNPALLNHFLVSERGQKQIDSFQAGGNRQGLNFAQIRSFEIPLPSTVNEQSRIADCLSSIDELLTFEAQKLDTLKTHKKGLMQQLFPAEGNTVPQLRFPEFRDAGEWKKTTIGQVATYENGKAHEQDIAESGKFIVVNSKFISTDGEIRKFTNADFCIATKEDILMVLSDVPNGRAIAKCFLVDTDNVYTVNQRICKITSFNAVSKMLFYVLNRSAYFLAFDDGVKQTNLKKDDVLDCPIVLPKDLNEQQKITACLTSLDDLVTTQTQKLATLKTHKKGLMQQLFPALDEVQG